MATLEELTKIKEKCYEAFETYRTTLENQFKGYIESIVYRACKVDVNIFMRPYERQMTISLNVLDNECNRISGGDIDIQFKEYSKGVYAERDKRMCLNYGNRGYYYSFEGKGFYVKKVMLIAKIWEFENEITNFYRSCDWSTMDAYNNACIEESKKAQEIIIENQRKRDEEYKAQLDKIIKEFKVGYVVKKSKEEDRIKWQITIDRLTEKQVYLSHCTYLINSNKKIFSKNEVAEYILKQRKEQQGN